MRREGTYLIIEYYLCLVYCPEEQVWDVHLTELLVWGTTTLVLFLYVLPCIKQTMGENFSIVLPSVMWNGHGCH